jgi:hypothetical protein
MTSGKRVTACLKTQRPSMRGQSRLPGSSSISSVTRRLTRLVGVSTMSFSA